MGIPDPAGDGAWLWRPAAGGRASWARGSAGEGAGPGATGRGRVAVRAGGMAGWGRWGVPAWLGARRPGGVGEAVTREGAGPIWGRRGGFLCAERGRLGKEILGQRERLGAEGPEGVVH